MLEVGSTDSGEGQLLVRGAALLLGQLALRIEAARDQCDPLPRSVTRGIERHCTDDAELAPRAVLAAGKRGLEQVGLGAAGADVHAQAGHRGIVNKVTA